MGPMPMNFQTGMGYQRERGVRKVFTSYHECASVWVRQTQKEGAAGRGRLYFSGNVIYSYRNSWPLAAIVYGKGDVAYVLVNTQRYGTTTSRHLREVRSAISRYFGEAHTVFEVDTDTLRSVVDFASGGAPHAKGKEAVYGFYSERLKESLEMAGKARVSGNRPFHLNRANRLVEDANRFAKAFGDPVQFPTNATEAHVVGLRDALREAA